jgi:hypothetical protein
VRVPDVIVAASAKRGSSRALSPAANGPVTRAEPSRALTFRSTLADFSSGRF